MLFLILSFFLMFPTLVQATDWCGKTLPGGNSITTRVTTYLDADQFCNGEGIKIPSYAYLHGNGKRVYGNFNSGKACIRATNSSYSAVSNLEVLNCGAEGIDFSGVQRPTIKYISSHNNKINGIRCNNCYKLVLSDIHSYSNGSSGIYIQGSNNVNAIRNVAMYNNLDGVRVSSSFDIDFYNSYLEFNGYKDVEFTNGTNDSFAVRGYNGNCFFSNGAFNNLCTDYRTCKTDGTGHGSNKCE